MKKLLLMLIISLSVLAYRSPDLMHAIDIGVHAPAIDSHAAALAAVPPKLPRGMTALQFAELANKDPAAYKKLVEGIVLPVPRNERDKLMHFFAHGSYE